MRVRTFWPFRHFGLKLVSLALAVMLWIVVSGEETVERGLRVPLEMQQFPAGLEIQGEAPTTVDVRVRGTSGTLSRLSPGDVVAVLDLRGARSGNRLFQLTPEQVRAPFGIEVVQVMPATLALVFENSATRRVRVDASIDGKPAPGYLIGKTTVAPTDVEVVGPESAVRRATEAITEPVSVEGAREPVRETVTVGLLDPALRLKTQRGATVMVEILPAPLERTVRRRPVHLRGLAPMLTAEALPAVVDIGIRGSRETLNRVDPDDVVAHVDVAGLGAGEYTMTVHADTTADAGITSIEPKTVQVRITSAKD